MKAEEELIREALQGESSSFGELVERFHSRLYNAMLQMARSHDDAEDIVQESFVQAYLKLDSFQGNSQFFTWLYRIAFNNALSHGRRKRAQISLDQGRELMGTDPEDSAEAPDQPMIRDERIAQVHSALDQLSDEHRAILILREMQEASYEDIAEILSIKIGTVRSRLSRARNQLKQQLEAIDTGEYGDHSSF